MFVSSVHSHHCLIFEGKVVSLPCEWSILGGFTLELFLGLSRKFLGPNSLAYLSETLVMRTWNNSFITFPLCLRFYRVRQTSIWLKYVTKLFSSSLTPLQNKLVCLSLARFFPARLIYPDWGTKRYSTRVGSSLRRKNVPRTNTPAYFAAASVTKKVL